MPDPFDTSDALVRDHQQTFLRRYQTARDEIEQAFEKLKASEDRKPSHWRALLRDAEQAYHRAFDGSEAAADAEGFIRRVENKQVQAANEQKPDLAPRADGLDPETRRALLQDQIDAMRALIDDYFDRIREKTPRDDSTGLVPVALLGATVAGASGVIRRRAEFYGRDQAGRIYNEATKAVARQTKSLGYEWLRTTSANPRERHLGRVGETFEWGEVEDEPGDLPNCKCGARPIWTTIPNN